MGIIKDGINHICKRLDEMRDIERMKSDRLQQITMDCVNMRKELVTLTNLINDIGEMLEDGKDKGGSRIEVKPVNNSKDEALFLVSGTELWNLLEACKGATVRMKESKK